MSRSARPFRGRHASKRLDVDKLASLLNDGKVSGKLGRVFAPDGDGTTLPHWKIETDDDGNKIILVEVETVPDGLDLTCQLCSGFSSGGGNGAWAIPRVGSMVAVLVPEGEIGFQPLIVGE